MTTIDHQPAQPVAGDCDWQLSAACRGMDVETFYHPAGERWHQKSERITQAKRICHRCRESLGSVSSGTTTPMQ